MKTIRIKLPQELERDILTLAANEEAFIVEAVKEKIEKEKKEQFKKQCMEDCQSALGEYLLPAKGFKPDDVEYWQ